MPNVDSFIARCTRRGLAVAPEPSREWADDKTLRRRIEDALRKTARRGELLSIARILGVRMEA